MTQNTHEHNLSKRVCRFTMYCILYCLYYCSTSSYLPMNVWTCSVNKLPSTVSRHTEVKEKKQQQQNTHTAEKNKDNQVNEIL